MRHLNFLFVTLLFFLLLFPNSLMPGGYYASLALLLLWAAACAATKEVYFERHFKWLLLFVLLLACWSILSLAFNLSHINLIGVAEALQPTLRMVRALVSTTIIIIIWKIAGRRQAVATSFLLVLATHAILIIFEFFNPAFSEQKTRILFGDSSLFRENRATGLTSSYDVAGIYCCFGLLLTARLPAEKTTSWLFKVAVLLIFWTAGVATGRTFMMVGTTLIIILAWRMLEGVRVGLFTKITVVGLVLSVIGFASAKYIFPLISVLLGQLIGFDREHATVLLGEDSYYAGSLVTWYEQAPSLTFSTAAFFGNSKPTYLVDSGIFSTINTYGLVGFLISVFILVQLARVIWLSKRLTHGRTWAFSLLFVFCLYHAKLTMLFSAGVHEALLFVVLFLSTAVSSSKRGLEHFKSS